MNFAGLSKEKDRMNVIAYLRTLSAAPMAMPAPLPPEAFIEPTADAAEGIVEEASIAATDAVAVVEEAAAPVAEEATSLLDQAKEVVSEQSDAASNEADKILEAVNSLPE